MEIELIAIMLVAIIAAVLNGYGIVLKYKKSESVPKISEYCVNLIYGVGFLFVAVVLFLMIIS